MNFKVFEICRYFGINYQYKFKKPVAHQLYLWESLFLKAFESQSKFTLLELYNKCSINIIETMYSLIRYKKVSEFKYQPIHLYLNTFKEGDFHYGLRYKNRWFFITHTKKTLARKLTTKDTLGTKQFEESYIASCFPKNPVKYKENIGFIKTEFLNNLNHEHRNNNKTDKKPKEDKSKSLGSTM